MQAAAAREVEAVVAAENAEAGAAWLRVAVALLVAVVAWQWWRLRFFHRRGIPLALPAWPFVGSFGALVLRRCSLSEIAHRAYLAGGASLEEMPVAGVFEFRNPLFVVRDPRLIREVGIKQFDHFRNHRPFPSRKVDKIFSRSLFALNDQTWKDMRATMSPAFTGSKMRILFELMSECGRQSAEHLENKCKELQKEANGVFEIEFKDFFTRFATDVIATTAFGVHCDSIGQPDNEFFTMGKNLTNMGGIRALVFLLWSILPKVAELLNLPFVTVKTEDFFRRLVHEALTERAARGIYRPDVLQLMMEARDGKLGPRPAGAEPRTALSEDDIVSQAVLFFFAGFETVSNLLCFVCHLLATHPTAQRRLQAELDEALDRHGGQFTYDAVQSVKFLDMVVNETLRLFPPAPAVDRVCAADAEVSLGDGQPPARFRRGDVLWMPIYGIQRDPRFWPNPDAFDPERFAEENKHTIEPFAFMPFGIGPRICIAQRFAMLETKVALAYIVSRVSLTRCDRTRVPIRLQRVGFNTTSEDGFWCGVTLRDTHAQQQDHAKTSNGVSK